MIVKMKKTTVLCLLDERTQTLDRLRDLGLVHIDISELKESDDRKNLDTLNADAVKASGLLSLIKPLDSKLDTKLAGLTGNELCDKVLKLSEEESDLSKQLESLKSACEKLLPWGDFSQDLLADLRGQGMFIYLCSAMKTEINKTDSEFSKIKENKNIFIESVKEDKKRLWFAVVSSEEIDQKQLPLDNIPSNISLKDTEKNIEKITAKLAETVAELADLANFSDVLKRYLAELEEKIEYVKNRDGMGESDVVAYIDGWVPVPDLKRLQATARKNGWGLMLRDPEPDDNPPTYIKTPKIFELAKPIFDFIGISPGYKEWDISGCFLFFFTIFFGIIVGDAGYGLIFLIIAILAKFKFKNSKNAQLPIKLFILLSCSTIIWGFLNGTFFAIPETHLPGWMRGFKWFTDPALKNQHIQQLCFIIAAVHLSFGHLWKALLYINSRKAIGEIGWAMLLWGNYFTAVNLIVYPDQPWPMTTLGILYGAGFICVTLFAVNWKDIGDILNFPFGLIGTFVDLLSYIRLFAVGLSSYYIAKSFNDMGMMIMGSVDNKILIAVLVIPAVLVIFIGHIGNILLAFLGVLVHGIRLNTLEFSNHMNLQWLGHVYKPFKKKTD